MRFDLGHVYEIMTVHSIFRLGTRTKRFEEIENVLTLDQFQICTNGCVGRKQCISTNAARIGHQCKAETLFRNEW